MKRTDIDAIEQLLARLPVELKMCGYIVGCFHGQAQLSCRHSLARGSFSNCLLVFAIGKPFK